MQADNTQVIPARFRPSGDGRFLYRFWGRDYLLTPEQVQRHLKLVRNWAYIMVAFAVMAVLVFVVATELGFPWPALLKVGILVLCWIWLSAFYWRTAVLLDGCDTREVAKAKGIVARGVQWLEYKRSITLPNNPPPLELFVKGLGSAGMSLLFMSFLWSQPAKLDGLELVIEAFFYVPFSVLCLGYSALSFYAFCRAIARSKTMASGSDTSPGN